MFFDVRLLKKVQISWKTPGVRIDQDSGSRRPDSESVSKFQIMTQNSTLKVRAATVGGGVPVALNLALKGVVSIAVFCNTNIAPGALYFTKKVL